MKRKFLLPLCLLTLTFALGKYTLPQASSQSNDYLIVFTSAVNIDFLSIERGGIFVMRPDGSGLRQLTSFQTLNYDFEPHGLNLPDDHPAFSPDGTQIVFTSNRADPNNWDLYIMDVNGTDPIQITTEAGLDTEPVFSPDGTKLAFSSERMGNLDIWVMNVDGSNPVRLTTSGLEDIEPVWSPDGSQIAFSRVQSEDEKDVFIMNSDGTNQVQLTNVAGEDHDGTFSPDGTQMVITSERDGTNPFGDVFKIRVSDGVSLGNLTDALFTGGGDPAWSPDGAKVAFFKSSLPILTAPQQLWIMDSNGTNHQRLDNENDLGIINIHPNWGVLADSDQDGRPDYLESENISLGQSELATGESTGDQLGAAVALADYNHDGYLDLFAGIPGENVNGIADAGEMTIAFGTQFGPIFAGPWYLITPSTLDAADLGAVRSTNGHLGQTMVACDFNGDGFEDIAVGAPGQNRVFVSTGYTTGWQVLSGNGSFGASLAAGDFNKDNKCDLAVGSPTESRLVLFQTIINAGAVRVFSGTTSGVSTSPLVFDQGDLPLVADAGKEETGDQFGYSLAAGQVNGNFVDDLVVGVYGEDIAGVSDAGMVYLIPGLSGGALQTSQAIARDARSLPAPFTGLQANAHFGSRLALGDFDHDIFRIYDLVVGIPFQDVNGVTDTGLLAIYNGLLSTEHLASEATAINLTHVGSNLSANARFGMTLAAGDMSGDVIDDLAVAAPGQNVGVFSQAGSIYLLFGSKNTQPTCTLCVPINPLFGGSGGGLVPAAAQILTQPQVGRGLAANDHFGSSLLLPGANTMDIADADLDGQGDLAIGTPEEDVFNQANSGLISVRFGIKVGETVMTPVSGISQADEPTTFALNWTHPVRWRDLTAMHIRWRNDKGVALWIKYEEETNLFSLFDPQTQTFASSGEPGSPLTLETDTARLDLANTTAVGSGPDGRELTLTMRVIFKESGANNVYQIENMVLDDYGNNQGFDPLGTWGVGPFKTMLPILVTGSD